MIEYIKGKLAVKMPHRVVVEQFGVGFELLVSLNTSKVLPPAGEMVQIFTHLNWREDGPRLFGFATEEERQFFRILTKVNKVGPKIALSIMSTTLPTDFAKMILSEDTAKLKSLKGVGPKLASRLIVELKEPVTKLGFDFSGLPIEEQPVDEAIPFEYDIREALDNLGYSSKEVSAAINKVKKDLLVDASMQIEQVLETVLRYFSS